MPKLIDLTRPLVAGMPVYPGDPGFEAKTVSHYTSDGFLTSRWTMNSHLGTHLDSPLHYVPRGTSIDKIPLETFYGEAALISLTDELKKSRNGLKITPEILEPYTEAFNKCTRIIIQTGWENKFGEAKYYDSFPSVTVESAQWMLNHKMELLGFDTPSLSSIKSENEDSANDDAVCHRILLRNKPPVIILEGLMNLSELPVYPEKFTLCCFPLNIEKADGSPTRAVAIL
ncbi:MAG: cyclase family protein [Thermoguttaceae bacterium]